MSNPILVSAEQLNELIATDACLVVDCRYDFSGADHGRQAWLENHVPGAVYAHLDDDLAAPVTDDSGRHPLPETGRFARYLASIGWTPGQLLVAYDGASGAMASRLWWLMRYYGQPAALLDGGLQAWQAAGLPLESGKPSVEETGLPQLVPLSGMAVDSGDVEANLSAASFLLIDARAPERFSGEVENLDTAAGHVPGSVNRPFTANLDADNRFRPAAELRAEFERMLGDTDPADVVHSCGSGVTACHNLFAMELAGLGTTRLYPGSWSEWIRSPDRPIETG